MIPAGEATVGRTYKNHRGTSVTVEEIGEEKVRVKNEYLRIEFLPLSYELEEIEEPVIGPLFEAPAKEDIKAEDSASKMVEEDLVIDAAEELSFAKEVFGDSQSANQRCEIIKSIGDEDVLTRLLDLGEILQERVHRDVERQLKCIAKMKEAIELAEDGDRDAFDYEVSLQRTKIRPALMKLAEDYLGSASPESLIEADSRIVIVPSTGKPLMESRSILMGSPVPFTTNDRILFDFVTQAVDNVPAWLFELGCPADLPPAYDGPIKDLTIPPYSHDPYLIGLVWAEYFANEMTEKALELVEHIKGMLDGTIEPKPSEDTSEYPEDLQQIEERPWDITRLHPVEQVLQSTTLRALEIIPTLHMDDLEEICERETRKEILDAANKAHALGSVPSNLEPKATEPSFKYPWEEKPQAKVEAAKPTEEPESPAAKPEPKPNIFDSIFKRSKIDWGKIKGLIEEWEKDPCYEFDQVEGLTTSEYDYLNGYQEAYFHAQEPIVKAEVTPTTEAERDKNVADLQKCLQALAEAVPAFANLGVEFSFSITNKVNNDN